MLDVGARVAVVPQPESDSTPGDHLLVLPRMEAVTGRLTAPSNGATATSVVGELLGPGANCTSFPYLGIAALGQLVGEWIWW